MLFNNHLSLNQNGLDQISPNQHSLDQNSLNQIPCSQRYVLLLDQEPEDLQCLTTELSQLHCPVRVASSTEQIMETARELPPCLVILGGHQRNWSQPLVRQFRNTAALRWATIVALTDCHTPSWCHQEDNPGLDGFLVKPLSPEILTSLVQSAWARHACAAPT